MCYSVSIGGNYSTSPVLYLCDMHKCIRLACKLWQYFWSTNKLDIDLPSQLTNGYIGDNVFNFLNHIRFNKSFFIRNTIHTMFLFWLAISSLIRLPYKIIKLPHGCIIEAVEKPNLRGRHRWVNLLFLYGHFFVIVYLRYGFFTWLSALLTDKVCVILAVYTRGSSADVS